MVSINLLAPVQLFFPQNIEIPFIFSENVKIIETPHMLLTDNVIANFSNMIRLGIIHSFKFSFEILNVDSCDDDKPYFINIDNHKKIIKKLSDVLLSIWVSNQNSFTLQEVFVFWETNGAEQIISLFDFSNIHSINNRLIQIDNKILGEAKEIYNNFKNLANDSRLILPIDIAITALRQLSLTIRYIFLWVTLESLFGADKPESEITFRLSQTISMFLTEDNNESGIELCKNLKKSYDKRGKLIHGSTTSEIELTKDIEILENWVHKSLKKILLDKELINCFSKNDRREDLIRSLPYDYRKANRSK